MKNLFKTFQPFINKCKKGSLPILGEVLVQSGEVIISNLDTWVTFKTDLPDGMYTVINGEAFKSNSDANDFPLIPSDEYTSKALIYGQAIIEHSLCTADDPLRPAFSGIHINKEHMVATDAHVLKYTPIKSVGEASEDMDIIFEPVMPLVARIKIDPMEPITIEANDRWCRFAFSDCVIIQRLVEGKFPVYKSVIPEWHKQEMQCFNIENNVVLDMVKFEKAVDRHLMVVKDTEMVISNIDLALAKTWQAPENVPLPEREPDALLMPMMIEDQPGARVGFRPSHLQRIIGNAKGSVTIGFYDNSRAMAVWVNKEQPRTRVKRDKEESKSTHKPQPAPISELIPETIPEPIPEFKEQAREESHEGEPLPVESNNKIILILPYSEKAIAVFNAPISFREAFMECWGRYNKYLKHPGSGEITSGWIFSKKRTEQVREIISKAC